MVKELNKPNDRCNHDPMFATKWFYTCEVTRVKILGCFTMINPVKLVTPPKTNGWIPKNWWFVDGSPFRRAFSGSMLDVWGVTKLPMIYDLNIPQNHHPAIRFDGGKIRW